MADLKGPRRYTFVPRYLVVGTDNTIKVPLESTVDLTSASDVNFSNIDNISFNNAGTVDFTGANVVGLPGGGGGGNHTLLRTVAGDPHTDTAVTPIVSGNSALRLNSGTGLWEATVDATGGGVFVQNSTDDSGEAAYNPGFLRNAGNNTLLHSVFPAQLLSPLTPITFSVLSGDLTIPAGLSGSAEGMVVMGSTVTVDITGGGSNNALTVIGSEGTVIHPGDAGYRNLAALGSRDFTFSCGASAPNTGSCWYDIGSRNCVISSSNTLTENVGFVGSINGEILGTSGSTRLVTVAASSGVQIADTNTATGTFAVGDSSGGTTMQTCSSTALVAASNPSVTTCTDTFVTGNAVTLDTCSQCMAAGDTVTMANRTECFAFSADPSRDNQWALDADITQEQTRDIEGGGFIKASSSYFAGWFEYSGAVSATIAGDAEYIIISGDGGPLTIPALATINTLMGTDVKFGAPWARKLVFHRNHSLPGLSPEPENTRYQATVITSTDDFDNQPGWNVVYLLPGESFEVLVRLGPTTEINILRHAPDAFSLTDLNGTAVLHERDNTVQFVDITADSTSFSSRNDATDNYVWWDQACHKSDRATEPEQRKPVTGTRRKWLRLGDPADPDTPSYPGVYKVEYHANILMTPDLGNKVTVHVMLQADRGLGNGSIVVMDSPLLTSYKLVSTSDDTDNNQHNVSGSAIVHANFLGGTNVGLKVGQAGGGGVNGDSQVWHPQITATRLN